MGLCRLINSGKTQLPLLRSVMRNNHLPFKSAVRYKCCFLVVCGDCSKGLDAGGWGQAGEAVGVPKSTKSSKTTGDTQTN